MKNIGQLMKQAEEMQTKMAEVQAELEAVEMTGAAGAGMVQLTLNGKGDLKKITIDKSLLTPDEGEVLEDLIVAAFNDARAKVSAHAEQEMQKLTGGLQLPGGLGCRSSDTSLGLSSSSPHGAREGPVKREGQPVFGTNPPYPRLNSLIQLLAKLPGLGPRSARRAALHLIKRRESLLEPLAAALAKAAEAIRPCPICGNLDTVEPCAICRDPERDMTTICVVEDLADLWALERTGAFRGRYHVLGGTCRRSTALVRTISISSGSSPAFDRARN